MQDIFFLVLTLLAFGLLVALVHGAERLRQGAGDE